jgi:hypothetical protein
MVTFSRRVVAVAALTALSGIAAFAQSVLSTHSGVLHVSEGAVFANDQPVDQKYGTFPDIKEKSILRTEAGRAEILLTPGVFLRIGENSAVKMIDNRLSDTRVELLKGSAVIECDDPMKENSVTMISGDFQVHIRKSSVLEMIADPAAVKVFHGDAEVELNGTIAKVGGGKMMAFTQALAQEKFDVKTAGDELTRWSQERSEAVAIANVSAAKSVRDSGGLLGTSLLANRISPYGNWYYNPYYSMYTYLPMNGMLFNAYGYGFFSPYTVYQFYNGGYGYGGYGYIPTQGNATTGTVTSSSNRPHVGLGSIGVFRATSGSVGSARTGLTVMPTAATPSTPTTTSSSTTVSTFVGRGTSAPAGVSGARSGRSK